MYSQSVCSSRWNPDILCSHPYTLHFLMDLIWRQMRQNEDAKPARWQLSSPVLSGEHWLSLVLSEACLLESIQLCPPPLSALLEHVCLYHSRASEQHSLSFVPALPLPSFRLIFFQMIQFCDEKWKQTKAQQPTIHTHITKTAGRKQVVLNVGSHRHEHHLGHRQR